LSKLLPKEGKNIFHHTLSMFSHYLQVPWEIQHDNAQHTGHATMCDFSIRQRRRSFHRIFGQRTALTLIRLITGSGASSNSECTSRGYTTLTNWNSVCSNCDVTSTRASLTAQAWIVHACRRTAKTSIMV